MQRLLDVLQEGNEREAIRLLTEHFARVERITAAGGSTRSGDDEHSVPVVPLEHEQLVSATVRLGKLMLYLAAGGGHKEVVAFLLSKGTQADFRDDDGNTAVMSACQKGHLGVVQLLLEHMGEQGLEETNKRGLTALHYAAGKGHEEVARLLLSKGAQAAPRDQNGMTPIMVASVCGKLAVVRLLVQRIGEQGLEEVNDEGSTALYLAAIGGHEEVVAFLISKGAQTDSKDAEGRTLFMAASARGNLDVVRVFVEHMGGRVLEEVDAKGITALYFAACLGYEEVVTFLISKGAQAGSKDTDGNSPLMIACCAGHVGVARLLLPHTGEEALQETNHKGRTALHHAATAGHEELVTFLLSEGAEANRTDEDDRTPLMLASLSGHLEVVRVLGEAMGGGRVNAEDDEGSTALHLAASEGHAEVVAFLLSMGAVTNTADVDIRTPLMSASVNGHVGVVRVLMEVMGIDEVGETDRDGSTALHLAADQGHEAVVRVLLDKGAHASRTDYEGKTPLMDSVNRGHLGVVKVLVQHREGRGLEDVDYRYCNVLHLAAESGHEEVLRFLLVAGADLTTTDHVGRTPRALAEAKGRDKCVAVIDWWQSELERRRVLSRAVCLHKASMTQRDMPTSRVPAYLEARVAAGHEPPIVEVASPQSEAQQQGETEASASGKRKAGDAAVDAPGDEVGEDERHATLELVLQGLNEELLTELMEGFYSEG